MDEQDKKDIKGIFIDSLEPFANAIKEDFNRVDQRFDKLFDVFATKEDLEKMGEEIRADFSNLQTAVDAYAKKADTYFQEMVMHPTKWTGTKNGLCRLPKSWDCS